MSETPRCALHPEAVAAGRCPRCGQTFCAPCLRPWQDAQLCVPCRRAVIRRRLQIFGVVTLMVGAPAAGIAWGVHSRLAQKAPSPSGATSTRLTQEPSETASAHQAELRRAERLAESGRGKEAKALIGGILAERPDHPGALHTLARLARQAGQHEEVLRHTSRLVAIHPGAVEARAWQAEALLILGEPVRAENTLRQGLEAAPRSGRLALALANLLLQLSKATEAQETLRAVLRAGPDGQEAAITAKLRSLEAGRP